MIYLQCGISIGQKTVAYATKNQGGYHEKNQTRNYIVWNMEKNLYSMFLLPRLQQTC